MGKFITGKELEEVITDIIYKAKKTLMIVSPFIKLDDYFKEMFNKHEKNSDWILRFDLCHSFRSNSATCFGSNCAIFLNQISVRFVPHSG
jgi:hypothetical protein